MEKNTAYAHANYAPPPAEGSILQLPIEQIYAEKGAEPPLKRNESIRLARNIQKYGVSAPIVVTPVEAFPGFYRYRVQNGAKFWRAACIAGLKTLPCVIVSTPIHPPEVTEMLDKLRKGELHIFAQAASIRALEEKHGLSRAEIAAGTGFSTSAIANKLRLCRFTLTEQQMILCAGLTERHARALLRLPGPEKRLAALQIIVCERMSVATSELLVEGMLTSEKRTATIGQQADMPPQQEDFSSANCAESSLTRGEIPSKGAPDEPKARKIPATKPVAGSICPKKFALHTLQPLYNSIERTLSIFRKTGCGAEMQTQEGSEGVLITIRIPVMS